MSGAKVKGWKVFDENLQCRNYQFEVGKTFEHEGLPTLCANGFHFHENAKDLFQYYHFKDTNRVCEIEAENVITGDDKSVCTKITVLKELTWLEVLSLVNTGKNNTGRLNTGDWNTGDWNTGNLNTGDLNTGNLNTGDWNTGNWNTCNFSAGIFNTKEQPTPIFNGAAIVMMSEFRDSEYYRALCYALFMLTEWIESSDMSDQEKEQHPEHTTTGGYLKNRTYYEACEKWWNDTPQRQRELIQSIPGFSKEIFKEVTGITI